jgi:hypothetical protein
VLAGVIDMCSADLVSINSPAPKYPSPEQSKPYFNGTSYAHVMVEGTVAVEFIVTTEGRVEDIKLEHSKYSLVGQDAHTYKMGHFDSFLETNVLETLKLWRYSSIDKPCIMETSFEWKSRSDTEQENAIYAKKMRN